MSQQNLRMTSLDKFGKVHAKNTSPRATESISAAQASIEAYRNGIANAQTMEEALSKMDAKTRKMFESHLSSSENTLDTMRLNTFEAARGILGHIAQNINKYDKEQFAHFDDVKCADVLRETVKMFNDFAAIFPHTR